MTTPTFTGKHTLDCLDCGEPMEFHAHLDERKTTGAYHEAAWWCDRCMKEVPVPQPEDKPEDMQCDPTEKSP